MRSVNFRRFGFGALVLATLVSGSAQAAKARVAAKSSSRASQSRVTASTSDLPRADRAGQFLLQAGPGLVSGYLSLGVSLNVGGVFRVSDDLPIYAGVDTFLTIGSSYSYLYYYERSSMVGLGLLGTGYYDFQFPRQPRMHIIGGMSAGPFIGNGVRFALLVRPGFRFEMTPSISITGEPVAGIVGSGFVFFPRAMFTFKI